MKATPKSCSCRYCKRGKACKYGNAMMKYDERAFRHNSKIHLKKGNDEAVTPAPIGNYYD